MRRPPRLLLFALIVASGLFGGQGLALAHASLARSSPPANASLQEGPPSVQLWFTEAVEARSSQIAVYDSARRRVDHRKVAGVAGDLKSIRVDLEPLGPGRYSVGWQVMSAVDGHVTAGSYSFSVGSGAEEAPAEAPPLSPGLDGASGSPSPLEVFVRWVSLTLSALLFSGFVLALLFRRPRHAEGRGGLEASLGRLHNDLRATMLVALAVLAALMPAALLVQAISVGDSSLPSLFGIMSETRFGLVWLLRLAVLVSMATLLAIWKGDAAGWKPWGGLGVGSLLLLTFSLNSHGAALVEGGPLPVVSDWLHLVTASAWVGGLVHLARTLLRKGAAPLRQDKKGKKRPAARAHHGGAARDASLALFVLLRFSPLAMACVGVLILTGLYNSWLQVASLESLVASTYGRTLLVKVGLSIPAVALGAVNFRRVSLLRSQAGEGAAPAARAVWGEAALGIAVFLAVALMVNLPPAREALAQGSRASLALSQRAGEVTFSLEIDPGAVGSNDFRVRVQDAQGRPVNGEGRLVVGFKYLDGDLGPESAFAQKLAPGTYEGTWGHLRATGRWAVETALRRDGREDLKASFPVSVEIPGNLIDGDEKTTGPPGPETRLIEIEIALIGLMMAGAVWVNRAPIGDALERPFGRLLKAMGYDIGHPAQIEAVTAVLLVAGLIAFVGLYLLAGDILALTSSSGLPKNPIPPSGQSRAIGKEIYAQRCLGCHGPEGAGDGPLAKQSQQGLDLRPHALAHVSGQIYIWVTYGLGADMPAFEDQLSDEQRWNLVNYVRTLGESSLPGFHAH